MDLGGRPQVGQAPRRHRQALKGADRLILATDPDREGEAISWHVLEVLRQRSALKDKHVERVVFNAITKDAVIEAMPHPREIDMRAGRRLSRPPRARLPRRLHALAGAVAQAARRALGRPRAVGGAAARSATASSRSRSVPPRILVARSRTLTTPRGDASIARARRRSTARSSSASTSTGRAGRRDAQAAIEAGELHGRVGRGQAGRAATRRRPSPPRRCSRRPRASSASRADAHHAGRAAPLRGRRYRRRDRRPHHLYADRRRADRPGGDRPARGVIGEDYGDALRARTARASYPSKAKNAQEAHEAIRPTDLFAPSRAMTRRLDADQARLYELIWKRTVASQMESAALERTTVDYRATAGRAAGTARHRPGRAVRRLPRRSTRKAATTRRTRTAAACPAMSRRRAAEAPGHRRSTQHFTEPPPRYHRGDA